jgi:serine phosphatase RsbU (regulator of sigma subunit)
MYDNFMIMKKYISVLLAALLLFISGSVSGAAKNVTFKIMPQHIPAGSGVHVCGNISELGNWNPDGIHLTEQPDKSWSVTVPVETGTRIEFKITRGSWETEAVTSEGVEFSNFTADISGDTTITIEVPQWRDQYHGPTLVSVGRMENKSGNIELFENWRYHQGDDAAWANPQYDDAQWDSTLKPALAPETIRGNRWSGAGWFRLHLTVDSLLWNQPIGIVVRQAGASELYLDGKLLYRFGTVGGSKSDEQPYQDIYARAIQFSPGREHLLAMRYGNHRAEDFSKVGFNAGFTLYLLQDLNASMIQQTLSGVTVVRYETLFAVIPFCLAFVHLLMFIFYPRTKENLYYAICLIGWGAISFTDFFVRMNTNPLLDLHLMRTNGFMVSTAIIFGLLASYANALHKLPRQAPFFIAGGVLLAFWAYFLPSNGTNIGYYLLGGLCGVETVRVFFFHSARRSREKWLIGFGFTAMAAAMAYQIMAQYNIVPAFGAFGKVYIYGILILGVSISIDFSRCFARTSKTLEEQILQVQELSEKALEQERQAKEAELSRRLLEAENARKSKELEEARQLQLSMSPRTVPDVPFLEIAVSMETATEVGGDYYDFHLAGDGTLTIALGDATGHGTRAGTMVATVKGLFGAFGHDGLEIPVFFNRCSQIIKEMHLGNLFMAMMMVRIKDCRLIASAAGMPPVLICRSGGGAVEELVMKGMPLGLQGDYPYVQREAALASGDTILMMSDGFAESFNGREEMLDYPRVKVSFGSVANQTPRQIIDHLHSVSEAWREGKPLADDTTFIVMKVK